MPFEELARHEAAHAVIARLVGVEVRVATIGPDGPRISTRYHPDEIAIDARSALVDLAGVCMERESPPARADIRNASRRCGKIVRARHDADTMTAAALETEAAILFGRFGIRAAALVDDNRALIDAVAAALIRRGELTGDQVDAIIRRT
jgi:hypothetical protein